VAAARRAIEDDIEDRLFAYGSAVQHLLRVAAQNGTVEAETAYLNQHAPGILDIDADEIPGRFLNAQRVAFDAWYTTLDRAELDRRIVRIQEIASSYGVDLSENPGVQLTVMALQDDVDGAVELALSDVLSRSVLTNLGWRSRFSQAQFEGFVADPRVQAALQEWEAEEAAVRDQVRRFLLDLISAA
jgi:hypothetical protein